MITVALLAILITLFSPFLGQIYVVGVVGKNLYDKKKLNYYYGIVVFVVSLLVLLKVVSLVVALNMFMVLLLSPYVFFATFERLSNIEASITTSGVLNIIYGFILNYLVKKNYITEIKSTFDLFRETVASSDYNAEMRNLMVENINSIQRIFSEYLSVIWAFFMILAIFFGAIILAKTTKEISWDFSKVKWPFQSIYVLIVSMLFVLYPVTFQLGIKFLVIMITIYLIQGISILSFFWKDYFVRSKFLLTILIVAILFNPYLLLLIGFVGLFDIWFNFRKIDIVEE